MPYSAEHSVINLDNFFAVTHGKKKAVVSFQKQHKDDSFQLGSSFDHQV